MRSSSAAGRILFRLLAALVLLIAMGAGAAYLSLNGVYQGFGQPVIVDFPKGTSAQAMAEELARSGVVQYAWQFLFVRALNPSARLQAGEYQFTRADSPRQIFDRIVRGDVFFYELVVPEGSNIFDIAASIDRFGFMKGSDFLRAARDPSPIRDVAPQAPTLEGYLFPSTYRVTRSTTVEQLCRMMTDLFRKRWRELPVPRDAIAVNEAVTLASLVEKETAIPQERPTIASVYENRLRTGMALDCDPTTIYAALLDQRYHGAIYRSDLNSANNYNTYQHTGLPPGPIANPGIASLKAALAPASTDFLYFVAKPDGSGSHQFSRTMAEHNRAVQLYRRGTKQQAEAEAPRPAAPRSRRRHKT
jgi:UPF0755 protein